MRCLLLLSALVVASLALQPPLFEKPLTHTQIMTLIKDHMGKRDEADVVGNFKHLLDLEHNVLSHIPVVTDFHGLVNHLNFLERFTKTTDSQVLARRSFFGDVGNFFKKVGNGIKTGAVEVGKFVAGHAGEIASGALKVLPSLIPIATTLIGKREVADVPARFGELVKNGVLEFFNKIRAAYDGAKELSHNLLTNIKEAAQKMIGGGDIKEMAEKLISTLSADVHKMLNKNIFTLDINQMLESIVPEAVKKLLHMSKRSLLPDISGVLGDLAGLVTNGLSGFKQLFSGIVGHVKGVLTPTIDNIKALATTFLGNATQLTAKVASHAVELFKPFASTLGPLWTKIQSLVAPLTGQ